MSVECSWLHADECEQGHYSGRATPDGVIIAVALAVVLVSVSELGFVTALRVANVVRMLDVFGDLLGPVVLCGQIIKWAVGEIRERGQENDGKR